jgi:F-type H+-transporting ATPase subunit epsilon
MVVAPGVEGTLGILPQHAPLITELTTGELRIKQSEQETLMAVSGGFLHVRSDRVTILVDAAERAEEIDVARAEEARRRAEAYMESRPEDVDFVRAEAALRRAITRLKVARRRRSPRGSVGQDRF